MSGYSRGAVSEPRYRPRPRMLPSVRMRWQRTLALAQAVSFLYLGVFLLLIRPLFRFGAYQLTLYERTYLADSINVGERTPVALKRARRRYERVAVQKWHVLSALPPGAGLTFPLPKSATLASGIILERYELWEPENLRQWRLYILQDPSRPEPDCLLVYPKLLGDWRRVVARSGFVHTRFTTDDAPISWPPQNEIEILGSQGWPAKYELKATNWQRAGINPLQSELQGIVRKSSDPPGRQYQSRAGAFWSYEAVRNQNHPPARRHVDIFMLLDEVVMIETDVINAGQVRHDLKPEGQNLALIRQRV